MHADYADKTQICADFFIFSKSGKIRKAKPDMDDASKENIRQLIDAGECFVKDNAETLDEIVNQLRIKN